MRGFTPAQRKAIRQVAVGTAPQKALEALGKALDLSRVQGLALTGAATYGSGGWGGALLAGAGVGARKAAEKMTRDSVDLARRAVTETPAQSPRNTLVFAT